MYSTGSRVLPQPKVKMSHGAASLAKMETAGSRSGRVWSRECPRTTACVRASRHPGKCKVGAVEEEEYEVESILEKRLLSGQVQTSSSGLAGPKRTQHRSLSARLSSVPACRQSGMAAACRHHSPGAPRRSRRRSSTRRRARWSNPRPSERRTEEARQAD